jgi:exopolysaccharide biosynthesis polyprenyl glycosylphosphotransferase
MNENQNVMYFNKRNFVKHKIAPTTDKNFITSNTEKTYKDRIERTYSSDDGLLNLKRFVGRNWRAIFMLLTGAIDIVAIVMSGFSGLLIEQFIIDPVSVNVSAYLILVFYCCGVIVSFGSILGLYRGTFQSSKNQQNKLALKAYLFSLPLCFASFFIFNIADNFKISTILLLFLLPIFFLIGRYTAGRLKYAMQEKGFGIRNAVIYGDSKDVIKIFERMLLYPELGYKIKGFILSGNDNWGSEERIVLRKTLPEYTITNIEHIIKKENIESIITSTLNNNELGFMMILDRCKKNKINFKIISPEYEDLLRFAHVKDIAGIPLCTAPRPRLNVFKFKAKRIFDIIGSATAIILLSPFFLVISLAILIEDGWPIFFKQRRALVKGMAEFHFYKFRSMTKDAENLQKEMYKDNKTTGGLFLVDYDPRVTRVGKFIRKYSLDEIPQFFNVLKGDMSLVGPRPLSIADLSNITSDNAIGGFYQLRSNTKPGITGLWQISGRREVGFKEMVLLDIYYIENKSILLDLEILFETVPVILFGRGAY